MKKVFWALVLVMMLLMTACAKDTRSTQTPLAQEPGTPAEAPEEVTLDEQGKSAVPGPFSAVKIVLRTDSGSVEGDLGRIDELTLAWDEAHTEANVEIEVIDDWSGTLLNDLASGAGPDIVYYDGNLARSVIQQGFIQDLGEWYEIEDLEEDWRSAYWRDYMFYDGGVYAFSYDAVVQGVFYRTDWFAEAGLQAPQDGWTYIDLRDYARVLAENGHTGVCFSNEPLLDLGMVLGGGHVFPEDRDYNTEGVRALLQLMADLIADGSIPAGMVEMGSQDCEQLFVEGQVGMLFLPNSKALSLWNQGGQAQPESTGYVNLPVPRPGQQYSPVGGGSVLMVVDREYIPKKETALRSLFDYLTAPEQVAEYSLSRSVLPVRYSVIDSVSAKIDAGEVDPRLASFWPHWLGAADFSIPPGPQDPNNLIWAAGISEAVKAIQHNSSVEEAIQVATDYYAANRQ